MADLPDINVWVALTYEGHEHHDAARSWFEAASLEDCLFCRVTQLGLLRLLTLDAVMGPDVLSQKEAWHAFDALHDDPRIDVVREPDGLEPAWRSLTAGSRRRSKQWTDTYLAAFAAAGGLRLVTFDSSLARAAPGRVCALP